MPIGRYTDKRCSAGLARGSAQRGYRREYELRLGNPDPGVLEHVARMQADGGPAETVRVFLRQQDTERERVGKTDVVELGGCRERGHQVATLDSTLEVRVGGTLCGHERMFEEFALRTRPPPVLAELALAGRAVNKHGLAETIVVRAHYIRAPAAPVALAVNTQALGTDERRRRA